MCKHRYNHFNLGEDNGSCKLQEKLTQAIPIDKNGMCIFHSQEVEWKSENDFNSWLSLLIESYGKEQSVDLREVYFIKDSVKDTIDYLEQLVDATIDGASFLDSINCENKEFIGKLNFESCHFPSVVIITDCVFKDDVIFNELRTLGDSVAPIISIEGCRFEKFFTYDSPDLKMNFSIKDSHFDSVQFMNLTNDKELGSFDFVNCVTEIFEINDSVLHSWIDFSGSEFNTAEFEGVSFSGQTSFSGIKVKKNLKFHGKNLNYIFDGITNFSIDFEQLQGEIYFENTNLSNVLKRDKDLLMDYEKKDSGKVKIGPGCIKYRIMTPDLTYQIKEDHQHLISEIGTSFATYFTKHNGYNLGVEIRNRTRYSITLFYFTDEDFAQEEFTQLLGITSARIFGLISDTTSQVSINEDALIDFKIDMMRSFSKAAHQIQKGNWSKESSGAFFGPLLVGNHFHLDVDAANLFLENINFIEALKLMGNEHGAKIAVYQTGETNIFIPKIEANSVNINDRKKEKK